MKNLRRGAFMDDTSGQEPRVDTVHQERVDRAESLRLTQRAVAIEIDSFDLVRFAHWVHTGEDLVTTVDVSSPDAAMWSSVRQT